MWTKILKITVKIKVISLTKENSDLSIVHTLHLHVNMFLIVIEGITNKEIQCQTIKLGKYSQI